VDLVRVVGANHGTSGYGLGPQPFVSVTFRFEFLFTPLSLENLEMLKSLWLDEGGAVLSAELLLLTVILVIGLSVGMVAVRDAIDAQFAELALSIAAIDTGFGYDGLEYEDGESGTGATAWVGGAERVATYSTGGGDGVDDLITAVSMDEMKASGGGGTSGGSTSGS
jgi:hypothetical protein